MPTKILVPRASGEGGMGVADNAWGHAYFDSGNFKTGDFSDSIMISGLPIDQAISQGGLGGKWDDGTNAGDIKYDGGNVGIGTVYPGYPLDVRGWISAQADALSTDAVINLAASNNSSYASISRIKSVSESNTNSSSSLTFSTRDTANAISEAVRIDSVGSVGIGTTNPIARLEVVSDSVNQYALLAVRENGKRLGSIFQDGNSNGTIGAYNSSDTPKVWLNTNGDSYFKGGDVGIGTASPSAALEIHRPEGDESFATYAVDTNGNEEKRLRVFSNSDGAVLGLQDGGQDIIVLDGRTQTPNSSFFNGGNVGIGTKDPAEKLEVSNGATSLEYLYLKDISQATTNHWVLGTESDNSLQFNYNGSQSAEVVISDIGDTSILGKLCVGSTTAGKQLDVNGTIMTRGIMQGINNDNEAFDEMKDGNSTINLKDNGHRTSLSISASLGSSTASADNSGLYIGAYGSGTNQASNDFVKSAIHFDNHFTTPKGVRIFTGDGESQIEERMRIDKSGNVGIGTTNPGHTLTVDGDLRIKSGDGTTNNMTVLTGTITLTSGSSTITGNATKFLSELLAGDEVYINLATYNIVSIASDTQMVIDASVPLTAAAVGFYRVTKRELIFADDLTANVGIGTANPGTKLDVVGGLRGSRLEAVTSSGYSAVFSKTDKSPAIKFMGTSSTIGLNYALGVDAIDSNSNKFHINRIDDAEILRANLLTINSNGNVGIGTTNPLSDFVVEDGTNNTATSFEVNCGNNFVKIDALQRGSLNQPSPITYTAEKHVFQGSSGGSGGAGNVGIGTTNPAAPLEISSTTGGVIMPRMSTADMNLIANPTNGEMIYNTTTDKFHGYAGGSWVELH